MTELLDHGLINFQTQIIDSGTGQRLAQNLRRRPAATAVRNQRSPRLGFASTKEAAATQGALGRVFQVQHDALVLLRQKTQGR